MEVIFLLSCYYGESTEENSLKVLRNESPGDFHQWIA